MPFIQALIRQRLVLTLFFFGIVPEPAQAWHRLPVGSEAWVRDGRSAIRGVTLGPIECPGQPPCGYGSAESAQTLDYLKSRGVNWIALTPFGRVWNLNSTKINYDFDASFEENRQAIIKMSQMAHARGMSVMIIPHIFVESSASAGDKAGAWRGEMSYGAKARWRRYLRAYQRFIVTWAEVAEQADADAFSLGAECKSFSGQFYGFWSKLIDEVRGRFDGLLTYSSNWYDEIFDVIFWDQLDLIGVNAFFELATHDDAAYKEYVAAAATYRERVRELAETLAMPVVFMELGYTARRNAGVKPWRWAEGLEHPVYSEDEQTRSYAAGLEGFVNEKWFVGLFLWRYPAVLENVQEPLWGFSPYTLSAEQWLSALFRVSWAADGDACLWRYPAPTFAPWHMAIDPTWKANAPCDFFAYFSQS